ncbi:MAG: S-layer homology domain-containing protein [Clostridia bacterium]|nr:S-layer homology domain-containing protein [Clostridia bacterium]
MTKKILSFLVAFILLFGTLPVSANVPVDDSSANATEIKVQLLKFIGAISEAPSDSPITRGDFAMLLCAVANINPGSASPDVSFDDVLPASQYAPYIYTVASLGYMNGVGGSSFKPNATISAIDAATALVRAMGYKAYAEAKGGYPYGYQAVGYDCDIFAHTEASKQLITDTDALNMCYSAVTAPLLVVESVGSDYGSYRTYPGRTILSDYHGIFYGEGVVTATSVTQTDSSSIVCSKGEITIDKELFLTEGNFDDLLGRNCEFFYKKETTVPTVIAAAQKADSNKSLVIDCDNIDSFTSDTVSYFDGTKILKAKLVSDFPVILNGRYYADFAGFANMNLTDSTLELVSNDGDNTYDIAFVKKCETFFVNSVDPVEFSVYFDGGMLVFDPHDENSKFVVYNVMEDSSRVLTDIVALASGDCISLYRSSDGRCVEMLVSKTVSRDTVTEVGDNNITLKSSGERKLAPSCTDAAEYIGDSVDVYLDAFGRVAKLESTTDKHGYSYGYLIAVSQPSGLDVHSSILLYTGTSTIVELDDTIMLDGAAGITLASRPAALFDADGLIRQVIRYQTNKKGYVTSIDTVAYGTGSAIDDKLTMIANGTYLYSNNSKGFGQNYKIGGKTLLVGMPSAGREDVDNYTSSIHFTHMTGHPIQVYDLDEDFLPCVIVYESGASKSKTSLNDESPHGVVIEVTRSLNYDGEACDRIKMMTSGQIVKYCVSNELDTYNSSLTEAPSVRPGDVILYSLNNVGEIGNIARRNSLTGALPDAPYNSSFEVNLGRVYSKHKTHITMIKDNIEVGEPLPSDVEDNLTLIPLTAANMYYAVIGTDSNGDYYVKDITSGSMENIVTARENLGNESVVYARLYAYGRNFETVIYKIEN